MILLLQNSRKPVRQTILLIGMIWWVQFQSSNKVSNNTWIYVYIKKNLTKFQLQFQLQLPRVSTPTPTPTPGVSTPTPTPTPASLLNINSNSNSNSGGFNSNSNSNSGVGVEPNSNSNSGVDPNPASHPLPVIPTLWSVAFWPVGWAIPPQTRWKRRTSWVDGTWKAVRQIAPPP